MTTTPKSLRRLVSSIFAPAVVALALSGPAHAQCPSAQQVLVNQRAVCGESAQDLLDFCADM